MSKILISVVIATHNRPKQLKELLKSLKRQDLPNDLFEVVIIDDCSDKNIYNEIESIMSDNFFYYRLLKNSGPAVARNFGAETAKGRIIAFTDDDCIADKLWLKIILKEMNNDGVVGVLGILESDDSNLLTHQTIRYHNKGDYPTGNIAYRKDVFIRCGGFDESFSLPHNNEDTDLGWRMLEYGKIIFSEKCIVFDPPKKMNLKKELTRIRILKLNNRLFLKHKLMYRKIRLKKYKSYFLTQFIVFPLSLILKYPFEKKKYLIKNPTMYFKKYFYNIVCFCYFYILTPSFLFDYYKLKKEYVE